MKKFTKAQKLGIVKDLLKDHNGEFTTEQLLEKAETERVARSAIFLSRKEGINLEAIRDSGRKVTSYKLVIQVSNLEVESNSEVNVSETVVK